MSNPRAIAQVSTRASGLTGAGVTFDVNGDTSRFAVGQLVELYPPQWGDASPLARASQTVRYLISAIAGQSFTGTMNYDAYANPPQVDKGWIVDGRDTAGVVIPPSVGNGLHEFRADDVDYAFSTAGAQAAIDAAAAGGGGIAIVPGARGALSTTGLVLKTGVFLQIQPGTWLEPPSDATSRTLVSVTGGSVGASTTVVFASAEAARTLVFVNVAAAGVAEEDYVVLTDNSLSGGTKPMSFTTKIRKIRGNAVWFYEPLPKAVTTNCTLQKMTPGATDIGVSGEFRGTVNTGDSWAINLLYTANVNIKDCKFRDFNSRTGLSGATMVNTCHNLNFENNYDRGSGSSGYAAFGFYSCTLARRRNNTAEPEFPLTVADQGNVVATGVDAFGDQTVTLAGTASGVSHFYRSAATNSGVCQAGGANTATLKAGEAAFLGPYDDGGAHVFNQNLCLVITGGTGAGQSRRISAYNPATKVATMYHNWTVNPDNTSSYEVSVMDVFNVVNGPGVNEGMLITGYNGATKVATLTPNTFGVALTVNSSYIVQTFPLYQDREDEGFGILEVWDYYGRDENNGTATGNGRGIKRQWCDHWSDVGSAVMGTGWALTGYALGFCDHFTVVGVKAHGVAAAGMWSFGNNLDGKFIGCDFQNNDQDIRQGFGGSADISLSADADMHFIDCKFNNIYYGGSTGTRVFPSIDKTLYVGADRFAAANGAPTFQAVNSGSNIGVPGWFLDKAADEAVAAEVDLPLDYGFGPITPYLHWAPTDAGVLQSSWLVDIREIPVGTVISTTATWNAGGLLQNGSGVTGQRQRIGPGVAVTPTGRRVRIVVYRFASDASDTYNADANFLGVELAY